MKVYMKNEFEQQTVRSIPWYKAVWLRMYVFARYPKAERPIVRFVV